MKKLTSIVAGAVLAPVMTISSVSAIGAGQIESGDIYRVKNVTKNVDFTDPASATCGDIVQFKVRLHNPGPDVLNNVTVTATLPGTAATSHVSKVTASSPDADPASTSDTATVNLDKAAKLNYVSGSAELLNHNNVKVSTLGDTIVASGVTIGKVGVSLNEKRFVQFQAKVVCETTPVTPVTPVTPAKATPTVIASTGPASTIATMTGLSALAAGIGYFVQRRRNILG